MYKKEIPEKITEIIIVFLFFLAFFLLVPNSLANATYATYTTSAADWYNKGSNYLGNGHYDNAINAFNEALKINPVYVEVYNNRGLSYFYKGMYDKAIDDFDKALNLNPNHISSYNNRALSYDKKGMYDKALDDLNKALLLNKNFYPTYANRAEVYVHKGMYDQAIEDCNKGISLNSKVADTYNTRGNAYRLKGMYEQAIKDYNKALLLDSSFADAYTGRANTYTALNKTELAKADFDKAKELSPGMQASENNIKKIISLKEKPLAQNDYQFLDNNFGVILKLSMAESEIKEKYRNISQQYYPNNRNFNYTYKFQDGEILFDFSGAVYTKKWEFVRVALYTIIVESKSIVTSRNITIGDTEEILLQAYGGNLTKKIVDNNKVYILNSKFNLDENLLFVLDEKGYIVRMSLARGQGF